MLEGSIAHEVCGGVLAKPGTVRIGHPSGVMTMVPDLLQGADGSYELSSVAVRRTARRIMDGTVYVRK